jgi:hypothetical protein
MARTYADVLEEIKNYPERHLHLEFQTLQACCVVEVTENGNVVQAIDPRLLEAHTDYAPLGYNGGRACDVLDGPCSCGAWHHLPKA